MTTIFLRARIWLVLLVVCSCAAPFYTQSTEDQASSPPDPRATGNGNDSTRVVGIIPAFNSSDDVHAPALSPRQKFHLFSKTVTDPFNLIMPAVNAVILSSAGVSSAYGSGFSGAAKRYASSLADSTSGNFFRLYVYPAMLHEDPRYFRAGRGSIAKRTKHVFGAVLITRKDEPSFRFNWSKLLASASSAGLSNAYYPAENRGARLTLSRVGLSYLTEIGSNALKEFWPDISKKMHKNRNHEKSGSSAVSFSMDENLEAGCAVDEPVTTDCNDNAFNSRVNRAPIDVDAAANNNDSMTGAGEWRRTAMAPK